MIMCIASFSHEDTRFVSTVHVSTGIMKTVELLNMKALSAHFNNVMTMKNMKPLYYAFQEYDLDNTNYENIKLKLKLNLN